MKGSTLIETLVYIALLSMLMVEVFSSVYMIIHLDERTAGQNQADTSHLLKNYHE